MFDSFFFFFFQAEDGIRDVAVTGVQTCALPIFEPALLTLLGLEPPPAGGRDVLFAAWRVFFEHVAGRGTTGLLFEDLQRTGEGRVGEEGRSRWAPDHLKKKKKKKKSKATARRQE